MGIKNNFLKKMVFTLTSEKEDLQKENDSLKSKVHVLEEKLKRNIFSNKTTSAKEEIEILKEKVKDLETSLFRCVNGKEKLDIILGKQKCSLDKAGIGFDPLKRKKVSKTKFVSSARKSQISCYYCHKIGHNASRCYAMVKSHAPEKLWTSRRSLKTNQQGPKMIWVPKAK